jgi:hypothetical protein
VARPNVDMEAELEVTWDATSIVQAGYPFSVLTTSRRIRLRLLESIVASTWKNERICFFFSSEPVGECSPLPPP